MPYYKITSLTAKLPKRHINKDSTLDIEYREGFDTKTNSLPVGATVYIATPSLPINYHKLRMKNLISVVEIGKNTFMKLQYGGVKKEKPIETVTTTKKPINKPTKKPRKVVNKVVAKEEATVFSKED